MPGGPLRRSEKCCIVPYIGAKLSGTSIKTSSAGGPNNGNGEQTTSSLKWRRRISESFQKHYGSKFAHDWKRTKRSMPDLEYTEKTGVSDVRPCATSSRRPS